MGLGDVLWWESLVVILVKFYRFCLRICFFSGFIRVKFRVGLRMDILVRLWCWRGISWEGFSFYRVVWWGFGRRVFLRGCVCEEGG